MALYCVVAVDGDWREYDKGIAPVPERVMPLLDEEVAFFDRVARGRFVHLVHTSPMARADFFGPPYVTVWREVVRRGAIGIHAHEDEPFVRGFYRDAPHMRAVITEAAARLRADGLEPAAHRGGFLAYAPSLTRILEEARILCDVTGLRDFHYGWQADPDLVRWDAVPPSAYFLDYDDPSHAGRSSVVEIPIGGRAVTGPGIDRSEAHESLWLEETPPEGVRRVLTALDAVPGDVIVSALTHTWSFGIPQERARLAENMALLADAVTFLTPDEARDRMRADAASGPRGVRCSAADP